MPFVHLANGEVLDLSDKEWQDAQNVSGTPLAYHKDGKGSHVIGVYPADYEYNEDDQPESAADTASLSREERAELEALRKERDSRSAAPASEPADNQPAGTPEDEVN